MPSCGQLAVADLVRDLAGLHVTLGIVRRRLELGQSAEGAAANSGYPLMPIIETISASRPNRVMNHGTPAAGTYTPRSNVGSSRRSASMSSTDRSHARRTVSLLVVTRTFGQLGRRPAARRSIVALHPSVVGRRRDDGRAGNQRRQVCQTPLGGTVATNDEPAVGVLRRGIRAVHLHDELALEVAVDIGRVRASLRDRNQRVLIVPRRMSRRALTSKMSAKSDSNRISIVRLTGRRP